MLLSVVSTLFVFFFFFNDTATTEIYTLSLHDALPIFAVSALLRELGLPPVAAASASEAGLSTDRKSTRLNSSHPSISYAVFCLKKKKNPHQQLAPYYYNHRHEDNVSSPVADILDTPAY